MQEKTDVFKWRLLDSFEIIVYYSGDYEGGAEMSTIKDLAKLFGNVYREDVEFL